MYGVQFRGTLQPNQSQRWFTYNLAPTTTCPGWCFRPPPRRVRRTSVLTWRWKHRRQLESSRACTTGAGWRHGTTETQH